MATKLPHKTKVKPTKRRPPPRRRSSNTNASGIFFIIVLMVLAIINQQAAMLVAVGLLPTIVLGFTAKGSHKSQRMMCVGLTNSAGIVILLGDVWSNTVAFESLIVDLNTWIVMWGAASIGYALNFVGPMIAAMILQGMAQDRVKNINQQKQELLELWGHEVMGSDDDKAGVGSNLRRPVR